jgi:hypothetical protein
MENGNYHQQHAGHEQWTPPQAGTNQTEQAPTVAWIDTHKVITAIAITLVALFGIGGIALVAQSNQGNQGIGRIDACATNPGCFSLPYPPHWTAADWAKGTDRHPYDEVEVRLAQNNDALSPANVKTLKNRLDYDAVYSPETDVSALVAQMSSDGELTPQTQPAAPAPAPARPARDYTIHGEGNPYVFPGFIDTLGLSSSDWKVATPAQRTLILRAELRLCGKNPDDLALQKELATLFDSLAPDTGLDITTQEHFGQA